MSIYQDEKYIETYRGIDIYSYTDKKGKTKYKFAIGYNGKTTGQARLKSVEAARNGIDSKLAIIERAKAAGTQTERQKIIEQAVTGERTTLTLQEQCQVNKEKVEAQRAAERQPAADKVAADKAAAEADRLKREAEEAAKPAIFYNTNKDQEFTNNQAALIRTTPDITPMILETPEPTPDITTEPIKHPIEDPAFIDTFIFDLTSAWQKLLEMFK